MPIPKIFLTIGLMAANMALTMTRKIEGPRLDDLKFTSGDYGAPVPDVYGMRRLACPIFWAEDLREVKRRRKTKGGKFNDYSYFGTFAFALAAHEIEGVRRVWLDKHLVLDLSGAGPVSPFDFTSEESGGKSALGAGAGAILASDYFAIYPGSETQEPDPRMMATVEALQGEGSCPAYRGTAYVMVKDLPLEKFGNRIPQIEAEVISLTTAVWPWEEVAIEQGGNSLVFSPDFSLLYSSANGGISVLDTAARAVVNEIDVALETAGIAPQNDGDFIALIDGAGYAHRFDVYGGHTEVLAIDGDFPSGAIDADGDAHWFVKRQSTTSYYLDGVLAGSGIGSGRLFADMDGDLWMVGYTGSADIEFRKLTGTPRTMSLTGLPGSGNPTGAFHYRDDTHDHFITTRSGAILALAFDDGAVVASYTATTFGVPGFSSIRPGRATFWAGFREFDSRDLSVIRALTPSSTWGTGHSTITTGVIYDPVNHALVNFGVSGPRWYYLDRIGSAGVTLGDIMDAEAAKVGATDCDFSALDQVIDGWSVTAGQGSARTEPLLDAYDAEIRPHDFGIEGIKRSGVSDGTLLTERFVAADPRYTVRIRQGSELPVAVTINFADIDADQQPNNVRSARPLDATGARGEKTIDLTTLVLSADDARGLGDRHFRRIWNERSEVALGLTAAEVAIEPGDVKVLDLDGETMIARCVKLTLAADGRLQSEWRYDHPSLALIDSASGAGFDGRADTTIAVPLLSRGFFLDVPYLSDADDRSAPTLYVLAAPLADGTWPGAVAYQETGGEFTDEIASVPSGSPAAWGYAATALADANPWLWDRGSSVSVTLQTGTLTGCTEAEIDADPTRNLALIGDELVNFTTATLTAPLTYTLSGFKRGRRGTEWACGTHAARDVFLLLATAQDVALGLSEVSTDLAFKAITAGRTTGFPVRLEPFTGASLKPYAPCHLSAALSGSDWVLDWVRRTRVGGAWTGGAAIPLSEASEEYEVEIMDGASVKRTFTGLTSPTVTYTAAQQTTDWGAPLSSAPDWRVYQISDAVGRGFVAEAA